MNKSKLISLFIRYLLLIIIAIPNLALLYWILTPITIYSSSFLLSIFYQSSVINNIILVNNIAITIIPACVAGSAFYLLLMLNLSTSMKPRTRVYSLIFSLFSFLIINIIRIVIFSILLMNNFSLFNLTHLFFWYFISSIIVFAIYLITIKIFKIRNIPFYSDICFVKNLK